jgi:nucleotide-binding universal stress UspA family protein
VRADATIARVFDDPATGGRVELRIVTQGSPVDIVLQEAANFDLMVIGVAEQWGLESQLFGWQSERIAEEAPCSLLIVRKHQPPES